MASYLVTYDLIKRKNYPELIAALEKYPYWHCLGSSWIVKSDASSSAIRDNLKQHTDEDDKLLVVKLTGEGAWRGFDKICSQWLLNNL